MCVITKNHNGSLTVSDNEYSKVETIEDVKQLTTVIDIPGDGFIIRNY